MLVMSPCFRVIYISFYFLLFIPLSFIVTFISYFFSLVTFLQQYIPASNDALVHKFLLVPAVGELCVAFVYSGSKLSH